MILSVPSDSYLQEPQFYHLVASNPTWQEAMIKKFQALEVNHTWDVVPLPVGKRAMPCK